MTTRSEREKAQKLNEQHQAILSKMLREEDNKYCADCEAKGATSTPSRFSLFATPSSLFGPESAANPEDTIAAALVSLAKLTC